MCSFLFDAEQKLINLSAGATRLISLIAIGGVSGVSIVMRSGAGRWCCWCL